MISQRPKQEKHKKKKRPRKDRDQEQNEAVWIDESRRYKNQEQLDTTLTSLTSFNDQILKMDRDGSQIKSRYF